MRRKTNTNSRAETSLRAAFYAEGHIARCRERIQALEDRRTSITRMYGGETVQTSVRPDKLLESIAQIDEMKAKIDRL